MCVVTTRLRCVGDLRFVPSFEHHGMERNSFSFLVPPRARNYEPLLPCIWVPPG